MGRISFVEGVRGSSSARMRAHCPDILAALEELARLMWHKGPIEPALRELVRLQVAALNQCPSCLAVRFVPGKETGVTEEKVRWLPEFESAPFTEREKLALRFATRMINRSVDDDLFGELKACFTEPELVDLGLWVGIQHGLGLSNLAFGAEPEPYGTQLHV